jgi:hypothetical protein
MSEARREVIRLIRRIQALTLELHELELRGVSRVELRAKEDRIEQLRWHLAAVARRAASDLGAA